MIIQNAIERALNDSFSIQRLSIENESHMHSVPPNSETHFKVVIVSSDFEGVRKVARHQLVYKCLADQMASGVHALALHTYAPSEWKEDTQVADSPNCMGGSKKDTH